MVLKTTAYVAMSFRVAVISVSSSWFVVASFSILFSALLDSVVNSELRSSKFLSSAFKLGKKGNKKQQPG